jgi:hypothetical protein
VCPCPCITLRIVKLGPGLHVVSLRYSLKANEQYSYKEPLPVEFETGEARFRLADGELKCDMKKHFASGEDARAAVEPALRAWEVDADLRRNRGDLRFKFERAEVIDRSPQQPGELRGIVHGVGAVSATGTLSTHVINSTYPEPPSRGFQLTPDVQITLDRHYRYLDGREPLQSMAYFCLTRVERICGPGSRQQHRARARSEYRIEPDVLDTMGTLTSEHGDDLTGRKATAKKPLTGSQHLWLEAAVKKLIRQVGIPKTERSLLRMSDLPPL